MMSRKLKKSKKFPHGPIRTCVICRTKVLKKDLIRFSLPLEFAGEEVKGRGAYVCTEHDFEQIERYKKKISQGFTL